MWKPLVGGVSLSTEGDDLGGSLAAEGGHVSVSHPHLLAVSCEVSSRRRRTLGAASWRIWPGRHRAHWGLALHGASQCPGDASTLARPRSCDLGTRGHAFDAAIRRVGDLARYGSRADQGTIAKASTRDPGSGRLAARCGA